MDAVRAVVPGERTVVFERFELPDEPPLGHALVRMERTIISAGTELANYTALDPGVHIDGSWNRYPWRAGYGGVGVVITASRDGAASGLKVREGELISG